MLNLFARINRKSSCMNLLNGLKSLVIFLFIFPYGSFAQDPPSDAFERLLELGKKEQEQGKFPEALEYYVKAEALAVKEHSKTEILSVKISIGNVFGSLSNFGESLGYYQQALELAETVEAKDKLATILNNIGLLYAWEKDAKPAIQYFEKAYGVANQYKLEGWIRSQIAVNLAHMYNLVGQYQTAKRYLAEVEQLDKTEAISQMWKTNYAESLMLEGNVAAAEKIVHQLYEDPNINCYVCITEQLSKIYAKQNKRELAIQYAQKSLDHSSSFSEKMELYDHISKIYLETNNYPLVLKYKDSLLMAKDSMAARINRGLYESNKVKFKVQEYQNELEANQERQVAERKLYLISIVFVVVLVFVLYRWLKNRQRQERKLAANRQKIVDLELDNLKNNIAEKNRKLSAKALYLSGRNELIEEVINALSNIPEVSGNKQVFEYMKTLKGYLKTDAEWDDFITYFEQANPDFLKKLSLKHPQLNPADIRFICYVLMNLDIREISTIFNITINAATKRKRRIEEKMGIDKEDSLYTYLTQYLD